MELGDHCGFDDLYVNDERIPVSREVFQAVCKENNHIRYLARCEKELNVMTWRKLRDECPEARLSSAVLPLTQ